MVELGDRVEVRGLLRRRRGSVNYVPGVSTPHDEMEFDGLYWVGVALDDGTFRGEVVDPDTGCLPKKLAFLQRGSSDSLAPVPQAPFE